MNLNQLIMDSVIDPSLIGPDPRPNRLRPIDRKSVV